MSWTIHRQWRAILSTRRTPADPFDPFTRDQGHHRQASHWVCPPPAPQGIEPEPYQENRGQVSADQGLLGFGGERTAAELKGDGTFGPRQEWHHNKRGGSDADA
jgi:hypothetical protein